MTKFAHVRKLINEVVDAEIAAIAPRSAEYRAGMVAGVVTGVFGANREDFQQERAKLPPGTAHHDAWDFGHLDGQALWRSLCFAAYRNRAGYRHATERDARDGATHAAIVMAAMQALSGEIVESIFR